METLWGELFNERAAENISEEERKYEFFVEAVFSFGFDQREGESQMSAGAPSFSI